MIAYSDDHFFNTTCQGIIVIILCHVINFSAYIKVFMISWGKSSSYISICLIPVNSFFQSVSCRNETITKFRDRFF